MYSWDLKQSYNTLSLVHHTEFQLLQLQKRAMELREKSEMTMWIGEVLHEQTMTNKNTQKKAYSLQSLPKQTHEIWN